MWLTVLTPRVGGGTFLKVMDATGYVLLEYVLAVTAIAIFGIEIFLATWKLNFLLVNKAIQWICWITIFKGL